MGALIAIAVGFALRALFVWRHPLFVGDALVYGELAHHMLKEHVYGLMDAGVLKPTLIRLPGYPLFLAACFKVFGDLNYMAVLWVQVPTVAAGSETLSAGVWVGALASDSILASFGWPGSRLAISDAMTWAAWVTLS